MSLTGEKLMSVLVDSLSVDELKTLLNQKKNASKLKRPAPMTLEQRTKSEIRELIIKRGILYPPKK